MSQQPERDRDWEHWPGRRTPSERLKRGRLKSLFTATDGPEAIEALIEERGRELALQSEHLAATISDLEQREERARHLRFAVEEMLRTGSQELDDRHAELNSLAEELSRREDALARAELEIAERRREAGAVELRRAALERRESALDDREAALERIAAELESRDQEIRVARIPAADSSALADREREVRAREQQLEARTAALADLRKELETRNIRLTEQVAELDRLRAVLLVERESGPEDAIQTTPSPPVHAVDVPTAHLLFVSGDRYRLVDRSGPPPSPGEGVDVDGTTYRVVRISPSPLPGDHRRCAYVQLAPRTER